MLGNLRNHGPKIARVNHKQPRSSCEMIASAACVVTYNPRVKLLEVVVAL